MSPVVARIAVLQTRDRRYLPGIRIPDSFEVTSDLGRALYGDNLSLALRATRAPTA